MRFFVDWMDAKFYPNHGSNWDDDIFRKEIECNLRGTDAILDLGAGAGIIKETNFRGKVRQVCGIDPDERVLSNPFLDEAKVGCGESIPYPEQTFNLVFSDNVLEHLEYPGAVFKEVARVLKPGGRFLVKTPNKWHYIPTMARLTPHRFHQYINRIRGRSTADTFHKFYRVNNPSDFKRFAREAGLRIVKVRLIEGRPEYLRFNALTYLLGWLYERIVNKLPGMARFRVLLLAVLENPGEN